MEGEDEIATSNVWMISPKFPTSTRQICRKTSTPTCCKYRNSNACSKGEVEEVEEVEEEEEEEEAINCFQSVFNFRHCF